MKCTDCKTLIHPVVALDIDGTLGQYHQHFIMFCAKYFGLARTWPTGWDGRGEFSDFLQLDKRQYQDAKLAYRQGGWKRWMPTYPGVTSLVASLHRQDAEVWLCTTRPWLRLDNIDPDTREWCRRNQIEFDGMLFGDDKYDQLLKRVDRSRIVAVVDDEDIQLELAEELQLPFIWRMHGFNTGVGASPWVGHLEDLQAILGDRIADWKEEHGWR